MSEKMPQTFANHTKVDPLFHFFAAPIFLLALFLAIVHFFAHITHGDFRDHFHDFLLILLAGALVTSLFLIRVYAAKVQDRVIRLEERMRMAELFPEPLRLRIPEFSVKQMVALRFASDAELPTLAQRVLSDNLTPKQIKLAIQTWRPDYWRV